MSSDHPPSTWRRSRPRREVASVPWVMKSHHAEARAERILVEARRAGGRIRRDAEGEARRIRADAALGTGEAVERLERDVARVAGDLAGALARFRAELEQGAASEGAAPSVGPLRPTPSTPASSRRASMRESPLAHLFRATDTRRRHG